ncbi:MAG: hypothetical protein ACLURP_03955 [Ruminococcus sp.]
MAEDKKIKKCPVSLQPDIENLLQDLSRMILHLRPDRRRMILFRTARVFPTGKMPGED